MYSLLGFTYFSVTITLWARSFENYRAKIHELDTVRSNEIKEHWSYKDQYWGMLLKDRRTFPLYRAELEPFIANVHSRITLVVSGIVAAIVCLFIDNLR